MNLQQELTLSYYKEIGELNAEHKITIVQHRETKNIYIKKVLDVYNLNVYLFLKENSFQGIPKIYEAIESDNQLIIIEEYISGETLESLIKRNGPIPESKIVKYILQICSILKKLHKCDPPIIHRDIKPSNIIITPNDTAVLLDLNAAKYMNSLSDSDTRLIGTQGYAAPEQYGFGSSNTRTDIYAIGMVMNTMQVGSFSNKTSQSSLAAIIEKCTELTPENRYDSIEELEKAIKSLEISYPLSQEHMDIKSNNWMNYLPPGFRTKNILHMLCSIPIYFILFWLSLSLEVKDATPKQLFIERFSCLFIFLTIVACISNYLDVHKIIPFGNNKNVFIKYLAIFTFTFVVIFIEFVLMIFLSSIAS